MNQFKKHPQPAVIGAIATPSHFQLTICMADSFLAHHPHGRVFILQVGGAEKLSVPNRPNITIITERELNLIQYEKMRRQYNNFELCNSLKPFLLQYIFDHTDYEKVCYFDSDLFIYENLEEEIWQKLDEFSVMLSPHLTKISNEHSYWQDLEIIRRGVFNGGFVGVRRDENGVEFLKWWGARLINGGYYRLAEGLNCDQGWLDLVSNFDINLNINRHPGINVAFWNLQERNIKFEDDKMQINGKPLLFFHFSGYSPQSPNLLSRNSFTITFEKYPSIRPLFDRYKEKLLSVSKEFKDISINQIAVPATVTASNIDDKFEIPVSVIIPCYNSAKFIYQAIASVLAQTLKPLELIVIDDGSTDETPEILARFGNLIKVIRQENEGVSAARNKGIEAACGEFVAFLDADDYFLDPTKLEEQIKIARQTESDILQCGWTIIDKNGGKIVDVEEWNLIPQLDLESWLSVQAVFPGALLVRRAALLAVGNFDTDLSYFEDSDLLVRLLSMGYKAEWMKKSAVAYRRHDNNATQKFAERAIAAEKMWDKFFSQPNLLPKIKRSENLLRYNVYLYLAFGCANAGNLPLMKKLLLDSRPFAKNKSSGELIFWLDYFKNLSVKITGKRFNAFPLLSSFEWNELTQLMSGFNLNAASATSKLLNNDLHVKKKTRFTKTINELKPQVIQDSENLPIYQPKINLGPSAKQPMGVHRSGWKFALNSLTTLHTENGIYVEGAIENRFAYWQEGSREINQKGWVGFFHHPPDMPHFYEEKRVPSVVLQTKGLQKALKNCYGVFCFSEHYRRWLAERIDVPVARVFHPTETPENKFTPEKFLANPIKRIVQIGHWLRKVHSIYFLPTELRKTIVHQDFPHVREYFKAEKEAFGFQINENSVEKLPFLSNQDYDQLLSENIVYLDLHATAVNNAIIECIVRNTPVLVNPLPAVKEYLGEDYPFYFTDRVEAATKSQDLSLIEETYEYLVNHPIKEKLSAEYFLQSIAESEIYSRLPLPKT